MDGNLSNMEEHFLKMRVAPQARPEYQARDNRAHPFSTIFEGKYVEKSMHKPFQDAKCSALKPQEHLDIESQTKL